MNRNLLFLPLIIFVFSSCRTVTYFKTPNDVRNMYGRLDLLNGKSVEGKINVNIGNPFGGKVKVYEEGDRKPMQFSLSEVKGYTVRGEYYAVKEIRGSNPFNISRQLVFMKRLTPENSAIHLFEHTERKRTVNSQNNTSYESTETSYFLQFPNEQGDEVWPLNGSRFVPNFDEKVSKLVSDCPALAQKISAKQEGYFYAQVTIFGQKRPEVLMKIIDEYNRCKSAAAGK